MAFLLYHQLDQMDCGPTCLRMVAKHYGRTFSAQTLRQRSGIGKDGVSLLGIAEAAEQIGFRTIAVTVSFQKLAQDAPLPCIVHWRQNHFVVIYKIRRNRIYVADPARGLRTMTIEDFEDGWISTTDIEQNRAGVALLLEPTPAFYEQENEPSGGLGLRRLLGYLRPHYHLVGQLGLGLLLGSGLQLVLPFLTQSVVDVGINTQNLSFIYLVLAAQLALMVGRTAVEFLRSWILLHLSTRVNIAILTDFLVKLMKLPMSFFDSKNFGDLLQRVNAWNASPAPPHRAVSDRPNTPNPVLVVQPAGVWAGVAGLQPHHLWHLRGHHRALCRLGGFVPSATSETGHETVRHLIQKPKQPRADSERDAGNQAPQCRANPPLGVGAVAGAATQIADSGAVAGAVSAVGCHCSQRGQEHPHHLRGGQSRSGRANDAGGHVGRAVYDRATQRPRRAVDWLRTVGAKCPTEHGAAERDSRNPR